MTLKEHIDDIRIDLEQENFPNEDAVCQGIIVPVLGALAWPTHKPTVVFPKYPTEGRRKVDYALCHPPSEPRAFIEVKRVGGIDTGTKQLFEYAFHKGVPIVILTDGQKWRFFHPAGEGSYEDRKVEELDLIEGDSAKSAKRFERYLNYDSVKSGEAAENIAGDYRKIVIKRKIEKALPEVWEELLKEENEYLLIPMMEKVENKVEVSPTQKQILTFLRSLSVPPPPPTKVRKPTQRLRVTMPDGKVIDRKHARDTFVEVIEKVGIDRVKRLNIIINSIPLISTSKDPERQQRKLGEYYIYVGKSTRHKEQLLNKIASNLRIDLQVEQVEKVDRF